MWRKTTPKGLKMKKFIERPDGTLVHDGSYIGEDAWDDDLDTPEDSVKQMIENNERLDKEGKRELAKGLGISGSLAMLLTAQIDNYIINWPEHMRFSYSLWFLLVVHAI